MFHAVTPRVFELLGFAWVKAHVHMNNSMTLHDQRNAYYYNIVDLEAKKAVWADNFDVWFVLGKICNAKVAYSGKMEQYHVFLLEMYEQVIETTAMDVKTKIDIPHFQNACESKRFYVFPTCFEWGGTPSMSVWTHVCNQKIIGGVAKSGALGKLLAFTSCILHSACTLAKWHRLPIGFNRYGLRDETTEADVAPLGQFLGLLTWWMRHSHQPMEIHRVPSLHEFGNSYKVKGFLHRHLIMLLPLVQKCGHTFPPFWSWKNK